MVSQYKIESQIDLVNRLEKQFKIQTEKIDNMNYSDFENPELNIEMKRLTVIRDTLVGEEEKLKKMQEEFDSKITPLKQVEGYDGKPLFRMIVPNYEQNPKDRIKEYGSFIVDKGYLVNSIDKQKGYVSTVYTFFVSKR